MKNTWILVALVVCYFGCAKGQTQAVYECNSTSELLFQCNDNKTCIHRWNAFCSGAAICPDGSDEFEYNASMEAELGMRCQFNRDYPIEKACHLPDRYICDHELDCVGGEDECHCRHTFRCNDNTCIIKSTFCDGKRNCADLSDETPYNRTSKIGFQCPVTKTYETNYCVLPDQYLCDGDSDCDYGIDECFCDFSSGEAKGRYINDSYSNDKCFRCLDGSLVIPNKQVCDGIVHCGDLSDECLCTMEKNFTRPRVCESVCDGVDCDCKGHLTCHPPNDIENSVCLPETSICDQKYDCENGFDEGFCPNEDQYFKCYDKKLIIRKSQFCDGPEDCEDGSDELYCKSQTNYYCAYYRGNFPTVTDWENKTQTELVNPPSHIRIGRDYPLYAIQCDGIPMCGQLDDECYAPKCKNSTPQYCNFVPEYLNGFVCNNSGSLIIGREVCDGTPTCNETHPALSIDELFCPNRFYCANRGATRLPIHIALTSQCDGIQDCDDQSDEIGCSEATHFYCEDGGAKKYIRRTEVCDGTKDCRSGVDECQNCNPSPFSSDKKLITSRVLIVFLWIIGLVAVVGNVTVMIHQAKMLISSRGGKSSITRVNRILVLNLSISDALVGIYLVSLGIKDATVDQYCLLDQEWRSGTTCSALGSIALIGTETSVFTLLIMTSYRLFLIVKPFRKENNNFIIYAVVTAWFLSLLLALLPHGSLLMDFFVSCVWYRDNAFIGGICSNDFKSFSRELEKRSLLNHNFAVLNGGYTWKNMFDAMASINSSYRPERYFGYYSAHSVCLPRLFPDVNVDQSWPYSLFIIILNFLAFVFILISYIVIYRTTTRRSQLSTASSAEDRANALQRKITRIVATDFCCWMPICIMGFIRVSGIAVPDTAYAVTAIILLPINAAMNPFLYSDIVDIVWSRMTFFKTWIDSTISREISYTEHDKQTATTKFNGTKTNSSNAHSETTSGKSPKGRSESHL